MKNIFSPTEQINRQEAKLVAGLERLSTLFKSSLQDTAKENSLTPLQTQFLIFIDQHSATLCSVTSLASEFSVTKATASDSLKTLVLKDYLEKVYSINDSRRFHYVLSKSAKPVVKKLNHFGISMAKVLKSLENNEVNELTHLVLKMLHLFSKQELITTRMCYSCKYYEKKQKDFYCHLLECSFSSQDLRLDCPEHETQ